MQQAGQIQKKFSHISRIPFDKFYQMKKLEIFELLTCFCVKGYAQSYVFIEKSIVAVRRNVMYTKLEKVFCKPISSCQCPSMVLHIIYFLTENEMSSFYSQ